MQTDSALLILGIGNLLMGDEGVGVHAIRFMEKNPLPENIELVDGGTGGFHLLNYLTDYKKLIMIDATMDGKPDGTITVLRPKFSSDFPNSLGAHDIGLKDLVEAATILGKMPEISLITVSISTIQSMTMELSEPVEKAVEQVYKTVLDLLNQKDSAPV